MLSKLDKYLSFHESELRLRAQRQEILASNIANADTPHYKARDIDFNQVLQDRLGLAHAPGLDVPALKLDKTDKAHLEATYPSSDMPLLYRRAGQASADDNTVDMDVERTQLAENSLRYEVSAQQAGAQIKGLLSVIQG